MGSLEPDPLGACSIALLAVLVRTSSIHCALADAYLGDAPPAEAGARESAHNPPADSRAALRASTAQPYRGGAEYGAQAAPRADVASTELMNQYTSLLAKHADAETVLDEMRLSGARGHKSQSSRTQWPMSAPIRTQPSVIDSPTFVRDAQRAIVERQALLASREELAGKSAALSGQVETLRRELRSTKEVEAATRDRMEALQKQNETLVKNLNEVTLSLAHAVTPARAPAPQDSYRPSEYPERGMRYVCCVSDLRHRPRFLTTGPYGPGDGESSRRPAARSRLHFADEDEGDGRPVRDPRIAPLSDRQSARGAQPPYESASARPDRGEYDGTETGRYSGASRGGRQPPNAEPLDSRSTRFPAPSSTSTRAATERVPDDRFVRSRSALDDMRSGEESRVRFEKEDDLDRTDLALTSSQLMSSRQAHESSRKPREFESSRWEGQHDRVEAHRSAARESTYQSRATRDPRSMQSEDFDDQYRGKYTQGSEVSRGGRSFPNPRADDHDELLAQADAMRQLAAQSIAQPLPVPGTNLLLRLRDQST
jgi:hypothetical protein